MKALAFAFATLSTVSLVAPTLAEPTPWDQAWWFREQVGLAPADLAAMGLEAEAHAALAEAVREHFATHAEDDGLLIDRLVEARRRLVGTMSWGRDARGDFDVFGEERRAVIQALQPVADQLRDLLPLETRAYVLRAIVNSGLDSPYRLLELTADQRDQIRELQEERDAVLLDARQRTRPARLDAAREHFDEQVRALLTEGQQTELDQLQASIEARLEAVWEIELAGFPLEEPLASRFKPNEGAPLPKYLRAQARLPAATLSGDPQADCSSDRWGRRQGERC